MTDARPAKECPPPGPLFDTTLSEAREATRRLAALLRSEQTCLADFLVALSEFDRDRHWVRLGHRNLFAFLHHELGLSNAAAFYRKTAAGLIRRFPEVVEPLRDGRLCITSVVELARVMTDENRAVVLPRFFDRSKRQARELAAEILPAEVIPRREMVTEVSASGRHLLDETAMTHPVGGSGSPGPDSPPPSASPAAPPPSIVTEPLSAELCRLHLTVTKVFLGKLDRARAGQSHAQPGASAGEVIETALDLLLGEQERRRGVTARPQANPRPSGPDHVPAAVRRAVWERDGGRCQWPLEGGGTCGSTLRVELDHVVPRARGGASTADNCRLLCRDHNDLSARLAFGDAWMDQFTAGMGH